MYKETFDFYDRTSLKSYNLDKTMRYQLNMLDRLDVFTRKHCENVGDLTCRLCQHLHCNKGFTEYCTICGYLHDIGKQFIPPEVLQKPGKLTEEEFEIMKTHTTIGYKMCMDDLKLRPYAAGPYYHHEALDGSGYPRGLTKKDIPYEAQIIRVADEYDAIVSKRQYKSHIGISDTLKILIENTKPIHKKGNKQRIPITNVILFLFSPSTYLKILLEIRLYITPTAIVVIPKIIIGTTLLKSSLILNTFLNKVIPIVNIETTLTNRIALLKSNGLDILNSNINPVIAVTTTHTLE